MWASLYQIFDKIDHKKSPFKVNYDMFQMKFCFFRNCAANRFIFINSHFHFIIFSIISTLFSASLTMSMSFVEAEVDYAENDWVKESLADEDDNSLYHYKNKKNNS